jgi:4-amino-4-deoxy-L-arabinose transferase-like glycosyltransferase
LPYNRAFEELLNNVKDRTTQTILLATLVTVLLYFVPYASFVTYPVRLFVTFIHEGSHALSGMITGGWVTGLGVSPDGSGLTYIRGGFQPLFSAAGYLGTPLFGSLLLLLLARGMAARKLLLICSIAIAAMIPATIAGMVTLVPGAVFGLLTAPLIALFLLIAAAKFPKSGQEWLVGFLGVQCVLNALFDLHTLFLLSATSTTFTDAQVMQKTTGLPAIFWASLWMVTALGMLWMVLIRPAFAKNKPAFPKSKK